MTRLRIILIGALLFCLNYDNSHAFGSKYKENVDYLQTSIDLLEAIRAQEATEEYVEIFAQSTVESIRSQIITDQQKIAFWVNVYNAYIQIVLKEHPEYYDDRRKFFKEPLIQIAGKTLSFSKIEHGIIRKSQWPLSLGYMRKLFVPCYERKLRVSKREARIHFALNCGAKSCPPVAIYRADVLDRQLDAMTKNYLEEQSRYDEAANTVYSTSLFSWFRGDFGGFKGAKKMLQQFEITPTAKVDLEFTNYDWTLFLDNFVDVKY